MMDEIIEDMKSKTPEELFECLYSGSEHFRRSWNKFKENNMISYIDIAERTNRKPSEVLAVIEEMEDELQLYKKNNQFGFPPLLNSEEACEIVDKLENK